MGWSVAIHCFILHGVHRCSIVLAIHLFRLPNLKQYCELPSLHKDDLLWPSLRNPEFGQTIFLPAKCCSCHLVWHMPHCKYRSSKTTSGPPMPKGRSSLLQMRRAFSPCPAPRTQRVCPRKYHTLGSDRWAIILVSRDVYAGPFSRTSIIIIIIVVEEEKEGMCVIE